jgi:predicted CXXCH cytochrome family protein
MRFPKPATVNVRGLQIPTKMVAPGQKIGYNLSTLLPMRPGLPPSAEVLHADQIFVIAPACRHRFTVHLHGRCCCNCRGTRCRPAPPVEVDCNKCNAGLTIRMKVVHAAVSMGCPSCHSGIADALKVPHAKTATFTKGLSAEQPELCYGCHDKTKFAKKTVHAAVQMGCLTCHDPHSSDNPGILVKSHYDICLDCHDQVKKSPHANAGFGMAGHPVGGEKSSKRGHKEVAKDPKREGKAFSCASCHNPHSLDSVKLFRYPGNKAMDLCTNCHSTDPMQGRSH